ncbi:MAG: glycosyhydrolase, partial [Muribaculaceae bacterium]|nr:glycosyhydrolase [Muribaculaceae bacterium]
MKINRFTALLVFAAAAISASAIDHPDANSDVISADRFTLIEAGRPAVRIAVDSAENSAVRIAAANLAADFGRVCGTDASIVWPAEGSKIILAGTVDGPTLRKLTDKKRPELAELKGKTEQYMIFNVDNPMPGVAEALVVAGSDRRGVVYGLYELSE